MRYAHTKRVARVRIDSRAAGARVAGLIRIPSDLRLPFRLIHWKKSSPDDFFETARLARRQKAWFLLPARCERCVNRPWSGSARAGGFRLSVRVHATDPC